MSYYELFNARAYYFESPKAESLMTVIHILFVSKSAFFGSFFLRTIFGWHLNFSGLLASSLEMISSDCLSLKCVTSWVRGWDTESSVL